MSTSNTTDAANTSSEIQRRVELLESFARDLRAYFDDDGDGDGDQSALQSRINRRLHAVREIVAEAGCTMVVRIAPPPALGGLVEDIDPILSVFQTYWGQSMIPKALDVIEQTIGVVESPGYLAKLAQRNNDTAGVGRGRALERVEQLCRRFPQVARQLQDRHGQRDTLVINDEYDVQDLFHGLLRIDFDDIRDEEWTPSYAGGCSRVDFLLKTEQVVVELKKTRQGLGAREVGEQLIIDIARYRAHPDCRSLVCFVYDPEHRIGNPRGLERDLTRTDDDFSVRVIISPNDG